MKFTIDLISDLHIETWEDFDWTGQPTSPYCIVAGDVCRDRDVLVNVLTHLGQCYAGVFYIDGNDEHRYFLNDLGESYRDLSDRLENIKNVVYVHDNVVIVNGIAILASNGWWTYDFDQNIDYEQTVHWLRERYQITDNEAAIISDLAYNDAVYMRNSLRKIQTHQDVKKVIVMTHTVPLPEIIEHDIDLVGNYRFNTMGNSYITTLLSEDTEKKVSTWVFGHYHKLVDTKINGIRYVNNCRGRGDTDFKQVAYNPKVITVDF